MSDKQITKREAVRIAIFLKTNIDLAELAKYITKREVVGIKVKDAESYLHLVVNKGIKPKAVRALLREYVDVISEGYDIDIPRDMQLMGFDISPCGKNWYIDVVESNGRH